MQLKVGDKISYKDEYGGSFKALIIEVWTNDEEEITGYFAVANSGFYVHFKPDSLECIRLSEPVAVL